MIRQAGFNVPLITCDGAGQMEAGKVSGALPTVNGAVGDDIIKSVDRHHPGGPYFVAEFYPAWFDVWGKRHSYRDYKNPARQLDWMLAHNVSVSMYMFHGGTNFTYTNGANTAYGYEPQPTSYDYDAPLGEYGNITPPSTWPSARSSKNTCPRAKPCRPCPRRTPWSAFPPSASASRPPQRRLRPPRKVKRSAHHGGCRSGLGYIHYETTVPAPLRGRLVVNDVRDYAVVIVGGRKVGTLDRRLRQNKLDVNIPAGAKLEILVENVGRVNYGADIQHNRKGITESVTLGGRPLTGWTITPLPLYRANMKAIRFTPGNIKGRPAFYRGTFRLSKVGDTFLDMRSWGKGAVWVNGHSIGKYWYVGPQQTLYVPGPWLREGENEVVVFEMEDTGQPRTLAGLSKPILDEVRTDKFAAPRPSHMPHKTPHTRRGRQNLSATLRQAGVEGQRFSFGAGKTLRHLCLEVTSSYDGQNACLTELTLLGPHGRPISKNNWQIVHASSEEPHEGDAENLIDDDVSTYWHSIWRTAPRPMPYRVIIDLGEIQTVTGVILRQRSAGMPGCVKNFTLYGRPQFFLFK